MRSRTAANDPVKAANKMLAKMQHLPSKPCSANARNLQADPTSVIAPHRNALAKTQAPSPKARQKNPAQAKPAGIFRASQQNCTATMLQAGRKIIYQMQKNAPRNQDKHAQYRRSQEWPNHRIEIARITVETGRAWSFKAAGLVLALSTLTQQKFLDFSCCRFWQFAKDKIFWPFKARHLVTAPSGQFFSCQISAIF